MFWAIFLNKNRNKKMSNAFKILTLDEILGKQNNTPNPNNILTNDKLAHHLGNLPNNTKPQPLVNPTSNKKSSHKSKVAKKDKTIRPILTKTDELTDELKSFCQTAPLQSPYDNFDKSIRYMRWLAFYYLSKKELSKAQLRKKLLDKGCDELAVNELIDEFAKKEYQSDERCASMLIRENIRKGRGKQHIKQALKLAKLAYDDNELSALIEKSGAELLDNTVLDNNEQNSPQLTHQDWLKLAVEARVKKYGDTIPTDPKEKAKQLRFLQYRGFEIGICFDALKISLQDL